MPLERLTAPEGWPAPGAPLTGCQKPTHRLFVPHEQTLGDSVIEFAEFVGFDLDEAVRDIMRDGLAIDDDGALLVRDVCDIESRQNGKTDGVIAVMLWATALAGYAKAVYTAHHAATVKNTFDRVRAAIDRTPELKDALRKDRSNGIRTANGEWQITFESGAYIAFRTRTNEAGRGLDEVPLLFVDEAQELTDTQNAALSPIQSTARNPQTWYLGSAGGQHSEVLAKIWHSVEAETAPRTVYYGWHLAEDADPADPVNRARVNRAYGVRIDPAEFDSDYVKMSRTKYGRERLGIADYPRPEGADWVVPKLAWETAQDPDGQTAKGAPLVIVPEAHPDMDWGSISVAGRRADGAMHLELIERDKGVRWMRPYLEELKAKHGAVIYLDQKGPAGFLGDELTEREVPFKTFDAHDVAAAFGWFRRGLLEDAPDVELPSGAVVPDPDWVKPIRPRSSKDLTSSLAGAQSRRLMAGAAWSRYSEEDASAIISANLAGWGVVLEERAPAEKPPPSPVAVRGRSAPNRQRPGSNLRTQRF